MPMDGEPSFLDRLFAHLAEPGVARPPVDHPLYPINHEQPRAIPPTDPGDVPVLSSQPVRVCRHRELTEVMAVLDGTFIQQPTPACPAAAGWRVGTTHATGVLIVLEMCREHALDADRTYAGPVDSGTFCYIDPIAPTPRTS